MIRIDEIYYHTFWPYIKNFIPNTCMYHFEPFGASDPNSILCTPLSDPTQEKNYIFFFDQEPTIPEIHLPTFDEIIVRNKISTSNKKDSVKNGAIVVSEKNSDNIDYICSQYNLQPFYYFFHGWAALDWYRGYDKTFLIKPWHQRTIKKTFFSPNRIIGGLRQHRTLMMYHFAKRNLLDNWISMSAVCPVENTPITTIADHYKLQYPDIVDTIGDLSLPMLFPNEDVPKMSSCWLDQFEICAESLIYHITETVYTGRRLQLTEKTFKPIALGMPFVMSAPAGSLSYLREYGFKTFSSIWDESYDNETDDLRRAEKVADLLASIDCLSPEKKQQLFEQCQPIIEHNWNHFYKGGFEEILWTELNKMLVNMQNYFHDLPSN